MKAVVELQYIFFFLKDVQCTFIIPVFLKLFFSGGTPKIIFHIQRTPAYEKKKIRNFCWRTEIILLFPIARQKFWQYFELRL